MFALDVHIFGWMFAPSAKELAEAPEGFVPNRGKGGGFIRKDAVPPPSAPHAPPVVGVLGTTFMLLCAGVAGCLAVMQTAFNTNLATTLDLDLTEPAGDILAADVNFFIFSAVLLVLVLPPLAWECCRGAPAASAAAPVAPGPVETPPWWCYLAGLCGAVHVTIKVITAKQLGLTVSYIFVAVGQQTSSLLIDHFGLLGVPQRPVTRLQLACASAAVGGAVLELSGTGDTATSTAVWGACIAAATVAGAVHPMQAALNMPLLRRHRSSLRVALINNIAAAAFLLLLDLLILGAEGTLSMLDLSSTFSSLSVIDYVGGLCGAWLVINILLVPHIGINRFFIAFLGGELLLSVVIDGVEPWTDALSLTYIAVDPLRVCGVVVALVAVGVLRFQDEVLVAYRRLVGNEHVPLEENK